MPAKAPPSRGHDLGKRPREMDEDWEESGQCRAVGVWKRDLREAGWGVRGSQRGLPAAEPHRHSAAGTPRCSPAVPAHTAAPASSLSETWAPRRRTPGGWVCWVYPQPIGSLETGGHSQPGSGGPGQLVLALTSLRRRIDPDRWRRGSLALPHPVQPPSTSCTSSGWAWALPVPREGRYRESASTPPRLSRPNPCSPDPARHPREGRGCVRLQH